MKRQLFFLLVMLLALALAACGGTETDTAVTDSDSQIDVTTLADEIDVQTVANIKDRDDVGVLQPARSLCLLHEALAAVLMPRRCSQPGKRDGLDGNLAINGRIVTEVHATHSALPQPAQYLVTADGIGLVHRACSHYSASRGTLTTLTTPLNLIDRQSRRGCKEGVDR